MNATMGTDIEPFVAAEEAAEFLVITRRRLLEMARTGEIPAHALGEGKRKVWRFRLSELAEAVVAKRPAVYPRRKGIIQNGSPRQPNRRN